MKTVTVELTWQELVETSSAVAFTAHVMTDEHNTPQMEAVRQRLQVIEKKLDDAAESNQPPLEEREALCSMAAQTLMSALKQAGYNEH